MLKKTAAIGLAALVAVALVVGVIAYSFLKPAAEASEPIQAIPIAQATLAPTSAAPTAAAPTATAPTATAVSAAASSASVASTAAASAPAASATTGGGAAATATGATTASTVYTIDQTSSEARFIIDEVLNGSPKTVVGTTNQVAGQIAATATAPSTAQVGTIQINARTLATDSTQRDNAIKNRVLNTNANEYITFVPTAVTGLPASTATGQSYTFQIVGQLTIAGKTREATFAVTVTPTADGKLQGSAATTIKYADWGISIPQVPSVTGVEDTVTLELDFVATAG